jgi:hypothetical protein
VNRDDQVELAALAGIAWEHRGEPDFRERIEAIGVWRDRRHIREHERRRRWHAAILQVLRETRP